MNLIQDTTQLPHDLVLFYSFSATRPLLLQNEAETPTYPSTIEEYTTGKDWCVSHCWQGLSADNTVRKGVRREKRFKICMLL